MWHSKLNRGLVGLPVFPGLGEGLCESCEGMLSGGALTVGA